MGLSQSAYMLGWFMSNLSKILAVRCNIIN